ncbi:MAG: AMP-binding protein [Acidimicrobiales bacterium]
MKTVPSFEPIMSSRSDWTLAAVIRTRAVTDADSVFLRVPDDGVHLTFSDTYDKARRLAHGFMSLGAQPGDRVAIMAANSADYVLAWFAASLAGLVEVPINTAYSGRFLEHQLRKVQPRLAVIDPTYAEVITACEPDARSSIEHIRVIAGEGAQGACKLVNKAGIPARLLNYEDELLAEEDIVVGKPRDVGAIFFTSGTTGLSKGVMMPNAQTHMFAELWRAFPRLSKSDVCATSLPLFHANAQFMTVYPALLAGCTVVLDRRFSASRWADKMREYGATVTNFLGVMMEFVWKQPAQPSDSDNSLRCIVAAPTPHGIEAAFCRRFGVEAVVEGFGSTETCSPIASPYGEPRPAGSCGLLIDQFFEVQLADTESGEEVGIDRVGELCVRPKFPWTCSLGYYGDEAKTLDVFSNLWWHSGDAMRRDSGGWFYFEGRMNDAIRRKGENISAFEVEQPISEHPAVHECAVVGVPAGAEAGEDEVMVFVVARTGATLTPEEIWAWCAERMPAFAVPRYVRLIEQLPKTSTEKVQKAALREFGVDAVTADRFGT